MSRQHSRIKLMPYRKKFFWFSRPIFDSLVNKSHYFQPFIAKAKAQPLDK